MSKFNCPNCSAITSSVRNTRMGKYHLTVKRARVCLSCGHPFHTVELLRGEYQNMLRAMSNARKAWQTLSVGFFNTQQPNDAKKLENSTD